MTLMSWRDEYRVGVTQIDSEHQYLFALVNEFYDKLAGGSVRPQVLFVLNRLIAYAEQHFQHEEALMSQCSYPRLEQHKVLHENLVATIFELNEKLSAGIGSIGVETPRFLKSWLIDHIVREDMDIGDYMQRKAALAQRQAQDKPVEPAAVQTADAAAGAEPN